MINFSPPHCCAQLKFIFHNSSYFFLHPILLAALFRIVKMKALSTEVYFHLRARSLCHTFSLYTHTERACSGVRERERVQYMYTYMLGVLFDGHSANKGCVPCIKRNFLLLVEGKAQKLKCYVEKLFNL